MRSEYFGTTSQPFSGTTADGSPYNVIVRRRCTCLKCGQHRIDKSLEFDPKQEPKDPGTN
jgi:hypothetical protein